MKESFIGIRFTDPGDYRICCHLCGEYIYPDDHHYNHPSCCSRCGELLDEAYEIQEDNGD